MKKHDNLKVKIIFGLLIAIFIFLFECVHDSGNKKGTESASKDHGIQPVSGPTKQLKSLQTDAKPMTYQK